MTNINNKKKNKGKQQRVGPGTGTGTGTGPSMQMPVLNPEPVLNQNRGSSNIMTTDVPATPAYQTMTENYKKPKIFVATPCYAGQVHVKYMESIMALQQTLLQHNIGFEFFNIPFDSLIPRARNASVTRFMGSDDATHLLFIDADIQFHPMSVVKMMGEDKDVICGCYPKKAVDFEAVKNNYSKTSNQIELIQSAVRYAYNFKPQRSHKIERGVVEILDAPTGFMLVKKSVIRTMIHKYPETEYVNDVKAYQVKPEDRFYDLFQSQVFNRRYLSEDYGFCRLWQNMGGSIHADLTVRLNHIGQFCYFGDPMVHLKYSNNVQLSNEPIVKPMSSPPIPIPINTPVTETNESNSKAPVEEDDQVKVTHESNSNSDSKAPVEEDDQVKVTHESNSNSSIEDDPPIDDDSSTMQID
jgi:hypothetical protein